jgi:branched-chain amino acid transport system permease protein
VTIAAGNVAPRAKSQRGIPRLPLLLGAAALVAGFAMPWIAPSKVAMSLMAQSLFDALLATSVGFLIRQNGRVSFGQAAFFGLGGYVFAILVARSLVAPEIALVLALAVPTLVAFLFGLVVARVTGVAHAMLTLAIGQALYEIAFRWRELAKGDDGMSFDLPARLFGLPTRGAAGPGRHGRACLVHPGRGPAGAEAVFGQPHRPDRGGDPRQ